MAQRKVTAIPATLARFTASPLDEARKRRVAGYARVSTDSDEQFTSYEAQVDYYTSYIKGRPDWEFAGIYTDEGISATNTKRREGFKRMVADALAGKIDLIVTKSVSRFARNTVDSLTTIRKLKERGVECYFEKENIWTFDGKGELLLTIMSSLAQEESRSISENCTWGQRKRFADGKVTVPFGHFLGYDRGKDGELIINPEQAETVRKIYRLFLEGMTPYGISVKLTEERIPSPGKGERWSAGTVKSILTNEKYKGDALLQKSYTVDFLTKKHKKNEGEIPQYYVENNHEAIIPPEVHEMVQREFSRRVKNRKQHSGVRLFSGRVRCGLCGSWYGSKVWHSNDKYRHTVWRCNGKYDGDVKCPSPHFTDGELEAFFLSALNRLLARKEDVISAFSKIAAPVLDTSALGTERAELEREMEFTSEQMNRCVYENARSALDQSEYLVRFETLSQKYDSVHAKLENVRAQIACRTERRKGVEAFLKELRQTDSPVTDFDPDSFCRLADFFTVYGKDDVRVTFKDGTEIRA